MLKHLSTTLQKDSSPTHSRGAMGWQKVWVFIYADDFWVKKCARHSVGIRSAFDDDDDDDDDDGDDDDGCASRARRTMARWRRRRRRRDDDDARGGARARRGVERAPTVGGVRARDARHGRGSRRG